MKYCSMLYKIVKLCKQAVLHEFRLQEGPLVNRTIEKALKAHIPKEVAAVLLREKVLAKAPCEITELLLEEV